MGDLSTPTDTEIDLLKWFWKDGELSVREVWERVSVELGWTASTTRTVLERMRAKGLLSRRSVHGVAVYSPAHAKVAVIGNLVRRVGRLLDMPGSMPASAFTGSQILDAEDLEALAEELAKTEAGEA